MSQKIGDIVNSEGKTIEQVKDEASKDLEQARTEYNDLANKSFQDSIRDNSDGTERVERKPSTAVGSQGYNPNASNGTSSNGKTLPNNNSLNKPGESDNGLDKKDGLPQEEQLPDKNETAPDIGKDYGESQVPQPDANASNGQQGEDGNQVDKNVPKEAQQQNAQSQENDENKEKKSNELDDIDKKKQEEQNQEEQKQQEQKPAQDNQNKGQQNDSKNQTDNNKQNNQDGGQTGNGYGALRRNNKNQPQATDSTQNARRNLNHQNKVNSENSTNGNTNRKGLGAGLGGLKSGLRNKIGGGIKNFFNKSKNDISDGNNGSDSEQDNSFMGDLMKKLMSSLTSNPYFLIAAGIVLLFIIIIIATLGDGSLGGRGKKVCTYELSGLSSTGTVEITDAKVELINCDGSEANGYEVLDTIDFEKYILGVTLAEAGPGHEYDDTYKAQLIAVRNFTLTRHLGMCPSDPDNCFFGYNAETNTFRMRACTNDQVYWDYTQDIYTQAREGQPSLYGKEAEAGGTLWKSALSEEEIARYEGIAQEVMGEVLLDENGDVLQLGYKAPETQRFISMPAEGYNYTEILKEVYGSDTISSAKCKYSGHFDYGDYTLTSDDDTVLNQSLESFLSSNGSSLEEFNELIQDNVKSAGYGTRAGVVAAAVTLIGELGDNYGVKVPYYWGGGHADGVVVGALGYWGSTQCNTSANGRVYDRCGLDCSGFVPWAIKNGGFNMAQNLASNFKNISGARKVTLSSSSAVVQPGDLLESDGHVVLVVAIDEENQQYICAEAAGYDYGVLFVRRSFGSSGYWGVDMEDYYNNESNVRESS